MSDASLFPALIAHDFALEAVIGAQTKIQDRIVTNKKRLSTEHEWLSTFALIFQSIDLPRALILSSAYTLSCAALKQEWDGVSVLAAISKGKVQYEKSPNIKNVLGEVPYIEHRLLQPIAHLTGKGLGRTWAVKADKNTDIYLSSPTSIPGLAVRLLDARCFLLCHLFLQLQSFLLPIEAPKAEEHLRKALERIGNL